MMLVQLNFIGRDDGHQQVGVSVDLNLDGQPERVLTLRRNIEDDRDSRLADLQACSAWVPTHAWSVFAEALDVQAAYSFLRANYSLGERDRRVLEEIEVGVREHQYEHGGSD
jgi:hypothetical protein